MYMYLYICIYKLIGYIHILYVYIHNIKYVLYTHRDIYTDAGREKACSERAIQSRYKTNVNRHFPLPSFSEFDAKTSSTWIDLSWNPQV